MTFSQWVEKLLYPGGTAEPYAGGTTSGAAGGLNPDLGVAPNPNDPTLGGGAVPYAPDPGSSSVTYGNGNQSDLQSAAQQVVPSLMGDSAGGQQAYMPPTPPPNFVPTPTSPPAGSLGAPSRAPSSNTGGSVSNIATSPTAPGPQGAFVAPWDPGATTFEAPSYGSAYLQIEMPNNLIQVRFLVGPQQMTTTRSRILPTAKTLTGWVAQPLGSQLTQIVVSGMMLDVESMLEMQAFEEAYKLYLEDGQDVDHAYFNDTTTKLFIRGRMYVGDIIALQVQPDAGHMFVVPFQFQMVVYYDSLIYGSPQLVSPQRVPAPQQAPTALSDSIAGLLGSTTTQPSVSQLYANILAQKQIYGAATNQSVKDAARAAADQDRALLQQMGISIPPAYQG